MRVTRFSTTAVAFSAFVFAGLMVGKGQTPAPQTQKPAGEAQPAPTPPPPLLHAQNLIMMPDDATKSGNNRVFGATNQTGFYITRNRFGANQTSRPHYHT